MATFNTTDPKPGYVYDSAVDTWYPLQGIAMTDAILETDINAKGDLIAGTANDTPAILTVGANGTVLTAASGEATGLSWATPISASSTDTFTNKKLSDSTTTIVDVSDVTKVVKFDVGGTTAITGTIATAFTTAKTLSLPDATDTLVGKATTDTLTNKTLTAPLINTAFNAQTGTTYTLVAADSGKLVSLSNAAGITLTVPISIYAAGEQINIIAIGAGQVTLAAAAGATIVSTGATSAAPKLRVQYSSATIICQTGGATPTFYVVGDLS